MLIAAVVALTIYFGGGGGFTFAQIREAMESVVADSERRTALAREFEASDEAFQEYTDYVGEAAKRLKDIHRRHDSTRDEAEAFFADVDHVRSEAIAKILDARFRLSAQMSEQEWAAMYEALSVED